MIIAIVPALLLATQPAPAPPEQAALLRTVEALFKPYTRPATQRTPAVWQRPIWSRETAALIARWRRERQLELIARRRPDLIRAARAQGRLDAADEAFLAKLPAPPSTSRL